MHFIAVGKLSFNSYADNNNLYLSMKSDEPYQLNKPDICVKDL